MNYKELFAGLKRCTGLYIRENYGEAVAFVYGCDAGNDYGLLLGFREWLIVRLDGYNNVAWNGLVLFVAFPGEHVVEEDIVTSKEKTRRAIDVLCDLLIEFLQIRETRDGSHKIFEQYFEWLHNQPWYVPDINARTPENSSGSTAPKNRPRRSKNAQRTGRA